MSDSHKFLTGSTLGGILIAGVTPYFLDRSSFWFEENKKQIFDARKTQSFFQDNTAYIEHKMEINLSEFLRKIDEMGYEKVQSISDPGEFSRHGGIIDVFPVNLDYAVRIEFYGNLIEVIEKLPILIKDEKGTRERLKKKLKRQKIYSQLGTLKRGDYLVHLDHGVGRFSGISYLVSGISYEKKEQNTRYKIQDTKYYVLEYASGDKLYVPAGLERKLSRYVGFIEPKISRLSSPIWIKTKGKIKEETEKLAKELLEIYAQREISNRPHYSLDTEIDAQITNTFPYEETPDQIQAIRDIKKDLEEKEEPMDRIICGDVGFGKTEVALRAMVKAVNSGYQSSLICPTTILASQHYQTFIKRIGDLPIRTGLLSRLQSKNEQKKILKELKEGKIDILIGTHRILSDDVEFSAQGGSAFSGKNLGLLVIDDEQRFGVKQKEKLRKIRTSLDILSLSATPIPRTLYLAMSSLKNISVIQTPPPDRQPVKTFVLPWSLKTIKTAIKKEVKRGGQVYYLHNRVETIETAKKILEKAAPGVAYGVVHGRLNEKELIRIMEDFQNKKIDVLIATTIIENGIDLPNVNTLMAADSAKLGLSQAYQIRGRIGRSHTQAFAYFLYGNNLPELAKERLNALKEAEELGSGYRIAIKDLELRGAGNILGKEQSGNINRIGLNLYCQMLSDAIEKLKSSAQTNGTL